MIVSFTINMAVNTDFHWLKKSKTGVEFLVACPIWLKVVCTDYT